jgi:hypothetical protein
MIIKKTGDSNENFQRLKSVDGHYFYWDTKSFDDAVIGDCVAFINKPEGLALFTHVDHLNIRTTLQESFATFEDQGVSYKVPDKDNFKRK